MRLVLGPIPPSRVLSPEDEGWAPLREPSSGVFVIEALLLSIPLLVSAYAMLLEIKGFLRSQPLGLATLVLFFVLMIPVHETIHAFMYPCSLGSKHLFMGVWMRRGLCYVVYDSPVSRNRILTVLSAPFIVVSSVFAIAAVFVPSEWRLVVIFYFLVHSAVCTGDFATYVLLIKQVPKNSLVHNDGWKTYWKSLP